jgi:hypothetical protein
MKPFDATKPVQTRDGRPARIICTDRKGSYGGSNQPIIALIKQANGDEGTITYCSDGKFWNLADSHACDLVNIPTKRKVYVVIFDRGDSTALHSSICSDCAEKEREAYRVNHAGWRIISCFEHEITES